MKSYIYIESLVFDVTVLFIAFEISYRFNVFFFFSYPKDLIFRIVYPLTGKNAINLTMKRNRILSRNSRKESLFLIKETKIGRGSKERKRKWNYNLLLEKRIIPWQVTRAIIQIFEQPLR